MPHSWCPLAIVKIKRDACSCVLCSPYLSLNAQSLGLIEEIEIVSICHKFYCIPLCTSVFLLRPSL